MQSHQKPDADRREFLRIAGLGVAAAGTLFSGTASAQGNSVARQLTEPEKLSRIASCCWPPRLLFKAIGGRQPSEEALSLRKKYGEITMLDFPQWTKDAYPGVYHLDLWSDVFGDPADASQYQETSIERDGRTFSQFRWDPSAPSSRKWLEKLAATMANTKTVCQHISNNAPQNLADPDDEKRKEGVQTAKIWMDAAAVLGAKTMRANTGVSGTRIMPEAAPHETGYPKNDITDNQGSGGVHRTRRELLSTSGQAVTSPARRVTRASGRRRSGRGAPPRPSSTRRRPR